MKITVSKRVLILSIISILVISAASFGGYYYVTNNSVNDETSVDISSDDYDKVYLSSYSETGFLIESSIDGEFWRFETIRPIFQGYMSDDGVNYIDAYLITPDNGNIPLGIYVSGELKDLPEEYDLYEEFVWLRREYDNEAPESTELPGEAPSFIELQEEWGIISGEQFEVYVLVGGPGEENLLESCEIPQYRSYCEQSYVNLLREWNIVDVFNQGAGFPGEVPFVAVYPYFIGQIIESSH